MHETRNKILQKLTHTQVMGFNELWGGEGPSNGFAYHLKALEKEGLIEKNWEGYSLTQQGKREVAYHDGSTGKKEQAPLIVVAIVLEKDGKYLMNKRLKEPFYGYWGFTGGKLKFSQYIFECAAEELKEETGLECDFELKGLFSSKTFNGEDLQFSHQLFIVKGSNPRGTLIPKTREGENKWVSLEEIKRLNTFPNIPLSLEIVNSDGFKWIEADRKMRDNEFKEINVIRNISS